MLHRAKSPAGEGGSPAAQYNEGMQPSPVGSFFRFLSGFLLFISLSFGITFAANAVANHRDGASQAASALKALLEQYPAES